MSIINSQTDHKRKQVVKLHGAVTSFMFQRYRIQMQLKTNFIQIPLIIIILLQVNFIVFNAKKKYLKPFT